MEKRAAVVVLKQFFGLKQGQTLKDFNEELKMLSPTEKLELARGAAAEVGCQVIELAPSSAAA